MTSNNGRRHRWNADNQPVRIVGGDWVVEAYAYDAAGTRVLRTREGAGGWGPLVYLHGDHLGSVAVATSDTGAVVSRQDFTPWGEVRSGGVGETTRNFTGQKRDGTGLLFYNARYYDPGLGRFLSADSIVPGTAAGSGGGAATLGYDDDVALTPLTVDFHEPGFAAGVNAENRFTLDNGFQFQLGGQAQREAKYQGGPANPQALNRYSYVQNNPVRYTDPTGHVLKPDDQGGVGGGPPPPGVGSGLVRLFERILQFVGLGGAAKAADVTRTAFRTGELFDRTVQTSKGPVGILAEVVVKGKTLHLKDIAIYPNGAERFNLGAKEMLKLLNQLVAEAKAAGFEKLRISGLRYSGANVGHTVDRTIDLTK